MSIHEKIRELREQNQWSQEEMADKMAMSQSGYAKIERGATRLQWDKLQQIAQIFNVDVFELIDTSNKGVNFSIRDHFNGNAGGLINVYHMSWSNTYHYYGDSALAVEVDKLHGTIRSKDEVIATLLKEVEALKAWLADAQKQTKDDSDS